MIALVASVLGASLLGSAHCAGMCGGFVVFYSGSGGAPRRLLAHAAYNGGRLFSYLLVGALAGALGAGIEHAGAFVGVSRAAAIAAGTLMVAWGAVQILRSFGARIPEPGAGTLAGAGFARALRALRDRPPALRALAIGLLSTLLPCGWLYLFVAPAAATRSPAGGALVMAAFWLGTVPVMAGLGLLAQRALGPLRRRLPVLTAAALMVIGLLTVAGKMNAPVHTAMHHGGIHVAR
jgi:uncharacterized protein